MKGIELVKAEMEKMYDANFSVSQYVSEIEESGAMYLSPTALGLIMLTDGKYQVTEEYKVTLIKIAALVTKIVDQEVGNEV